MGKHGGKAAEKEIKPEGQSFAPGADAEKEENSAGQDAAEAIQDASSAQADAAQAAPAEPIVENAGKEAGTASAKKSIFTVKIFNYRLLPLFLMMLCMSLAGFLVENLFRLLRDGVLNSRRQILPFLFAYGIAVFVLYVAIGTPREMRFFGWKLFKKNSKLSSTAKYMLYWLILFAGVFFGEVLFGTFVEWVSGVVLWDYTGIPLRFTKYTSVPTALAMSAGVMLFMRFIFEPLMRKFEKIPNKVLLGIDLGVGIPVILDWLLMLVLMLGFGISKNWWFIQVW